AGAPGRLAPGAEAGDRAVDDLRVALGDAGAVEAHPGGSAGLEGLHQHVPEAAQLVRETAAVVGGEVDRAAALAAVHRQVVGGLTAGVRRAPPACLVARARPLDLDH